MYDESLILCRSRYGLVRRREGGSNFFIIPVGVVKIFLHIFQGKKPSPPGVIDEHRLDRTET